jgi:hypothetical protein
MVAATARLRGFGETIGETSTIVVELPRGQPNRQDPQVVGAREEAVARAGAKARRAEMASLNLE